MEHRVHITVNFFACDTVKDSAERIGYSAGEQPIKAGHTYCTNGGFKRKDYAPAKTYITNH